LSASPHQTCDPRIAVIGMACRVPGAATLEAFWQNLVGGVESVTTLTDEELHAAGVQGTLSSDPHYVRSGGFLADVECFDAALFNYTPLEAALLDPQHRLLMECAWHALEHAGHGGVTQQAALGIYAGVANSAYYNAHVLPSLDPRSVADAYQALLAGERDFLTTRLSYHFNLCGPSLNVQTACSTSLVAVHLACQALLDGECDMALAGGAAVRLPQRVGYLYEEGMILSKDGHCRPFDAGANGTVAGNGAGIVMLRRLEDALADGDTVHAVVLGSAVNNDGSRKAGYTAPSLAGQAAVIREAQMIAGVAVESFGYIEAHGTGTAVGDPIEVAALTDAFRRATTARGFCGLGSVKSNIGHLDVAAGIIGFIKTVLAVERGVIPPSLHFREPNPALALERSPFFVPQTPRPWPAPAPRLAGVSAFGIGGTNAHVVLQSFDGSAAPAASRPWQIMCVSGKSVKALHAVGSAIAESLGAADAPGLPDAAFTLAVGRRSHDYSDAIVCTDTPEAIALLHNVAPGPKAVPERPVAWLFPDEGGAYAGMGEALARHEPVFREAVAAALAELSSVSATLPRGATLFGMEYGLSVLWRAWGLAPAAVFGVGIGEYAAAVAAGVLTLAEAARLIAASGDPARFRTESRSVVPRRPATNWLSSATGNWISETEAIDLDCWRDPACQPRHAVEALVQLLKDGDRVLLEVGPGRTLAAAARAGGRAAALIVSSCGSAQQHEPRALAVAVAALWKSGVSIDWDSYYATERRRRVPLPQYPFQRSRYWIERAPATITTEPAYQHRAPGAYRPTWTRAPRLPRPQSVAGRWVIVGDAQGLASALAVRLERAGASVAMAPPDARACRTLSEAPDAVRIVHLGATYDTAVALGCAMVSARVGSVSLIAVTEDLHLVTGEEKCRPEQSFVLGPLRVLPQEHAEIRCRHVDIPTRGSADIADLLFAECAADDAPSTIAIRGAYRWRAVLEPVQTGLVPVRRSSPRPVYLITGGLGLVGSALARHLHETEHARLVLVGRTELDSSPELAPNDADEIVFDVGSMLPSASAIRSDALAELKQAGADVLYVRADVRKGGAFQRVFAAAEAAFGRVDVVILAAGIPAREAFIPFEEATSETARRSFAPKVDGVDALRTIARDKPLRACVLMSSLSSVLGGLGFTAYAAANAYLDAVAQCEDGVNGVRWISLGWDAWQSAEPAAAVEILRSRLEQAIDPAQAAEMFSRVLAADLGPHVLISATDLQARLTQAAQVRPLSRSEAAPGTMASRAGAETADVIASIWTELLGVDEVGLHDDFYDLGGNSLLATQVISRLRRAFGIELSVRALFDENTVAGLAKHVEILTQAQPAGSNANLP
jgi:acyl transferase domain-containing protein/acyl carrier protein